MHVIIENIKQDKFVMKQLKDIIIPLVFCLVIVIIYFYTAAPAMLWNDAGDMIAAAVTFGVNVPPAPLYIFLAHFFTLLPFGSVIFRLQIFSVLLAVASLFLLYRLTITLLEQIPNQTKNNHIQKNIIFAGIFGILSLAFSYEFWSQAQNTDRFMLACLLEVITLYLLIVYASHKNVIKIFFITAFLFGLALGIDPVVISFFPAILIVLWQKRQVLTFKKVCLIGLAGLLGLILVLSYLPLASIHNPFLNYERPTTIGRIWILLTGQGQNSYNTATGNINGFTGSFSVFLSSSWHFLTMLWSDFTPILLPFIVIGGGYLFKARRDLFWVFTSIVITNFLLSGLYLSGNQEAWYLLSDIVFAFFAGIGYFWILKRLHFRWYGLLLVIISLSPFVFWWSSLDRQNWEITDNYRQDFYKSITGPAIIYGSSDLFADTTYYTHDALKDNQDAIPVIDNAFDILKPYRENLALTTDLKFPDDKVFNNTETPQVYSNYVNDFFAMNMPKYKVYITYLALSSNFFAGSNSPSFTLDTSRFKLIPEGMLEEVVPRKAVITPNLYNFSYQFSNGFPFHKPFMLENANKAELNAMLDEYAASYNGLGDYYKNNQKATQALQYYQKAYLFDTKNADTIDKLGLYYGSINDYKQALNYFLKENGLTPKDPHAAYNIGVIYMKSGDKNKAKSWFTKTLSLAKNNPQVAEEASNALTYLDNKNTNKTVVKNTSSTTSNSWQTFQSTQMNVSFTYPPGYETQLLDPDRVGLFEKGQSNPIITLYSGDIATTTDLDTYAKTFPYAIQGTFVASEDTPIDGFDQAKSYEYRTGTNETELVLMKKGSHIVSLTVPLIQMNDQAFGDLLTQIVQSINVIQ